MAFVYLLMITIGCSAADTDRERLLTSWHEIYRFGHNLAASLAGLHYGKVENIPKEFKPEVELKHVLIHFIDSGGNWHLIDPDEPTTWPSELLIKKPFWAHLHGFDLFNLGKKLLDQSFGRNMFAPKMMSHYHFLVIDFTSVKSSYPGMCLAVPEIVKHAHYKLMQLTKAESINVHGCQIAGYSLGGESLVELGREFVTSGFRNLHLIAIDPAKVLWHNSVYRIKPIEGAWLTVLHTQTPSHFEFGIRYNVGNTDLHLDPTPYMSRASTVAHFVESHLAGILLYGAFRDHPEWFLLSYDTGYCCSLPMPFNLTTPAVWRGSIYGKLNPDFIATATREYSPLYKLPKSTVERIEEAMNFRTRLKLGYDVKTVPILQDPVSP